MKYLLSIVFCCVLLSSVFGAEKLNLPRIDKPCSFDTKENLANGSFIIVPNEQGYHGHREVFSNG